MKKLLILAAALACGRVATADTRVVLAGFVDVAQTVATAQSVYDSTTGAIPAKLDDLKAEIAGNIDMVKAGMAEVGVSCNDIEWAFLSVGCDVSKVKEDGAGYSGFWIVRCTRPEVPMNFFMRFPNQPGPVVEGVQTYVADNKDFSISYAIVGRTVVFAIAGKGTDSPMADIIRAKPDEMQKPVALSEGTVARIMLLDIGGILCDVAKNFAGIDLKAFLQQYADMIGDPDLVNSVVNIGSAQMDVRFSTETAGIDIALETGCEYDAEFLWHGLSNLSMYRRYLLDAIMIGIHEAASSEDCSGEDLAMLMAYLRDIRPLFNDFITATKAGCAVGLHLNVPVMPLFDKVVKFAGLVEEIDSKKAAAGSAPAPAPAASDDVYPDEE